MPKTVSPPWRRDSHSPASGKPGAVHLATNVVCAGFEYVSGDAVHRTLSGLENAYRFEARDLFTHLLKRR